MGIQLNRRQLLRGLALSSGFAAFGGMGLLIDRLQLHAEQPSDGGPVPEADDHYFVFCNFPGGWDVLLSLDPRDPSVFNEERMQNTQIYPGFKELSGLPNYRGRDEPLENGLFDPLGNGEMMFGPFIGDLRHHAEDLLVVRGMNMESLAHQAATVRFLTGKVAAGGTPRGSSTDTWLASELRGEDELIPNLSIEVDSFNKGLENEATALEASGLEDLKGILQRYVRDGRKLDDPQREMVQDFLEEQSSCPQTRDSETLRKAEETRAKAASIIAQQLHRRFDFDDNPRIADPSRIRGDRERLSEFYDLDSEPEKQAAVAATALTNKLSRVVSCRMTQNLDSHGSGWSDDQGPFQKEGFDAVASLVDHLKSVQYVDDEGNADGTWFDHTTIVGFSEFSRTPLLNNRGGRDHWLMNACFLLGGGVRGGQVIGGSTDYGMYPKNVDLETGEVVDEGGDRGTNIHPEHIIKALYNQAGIDDEPDLRVDELRPIFKEPR